MNSEFKPGTYIIEKLTNKLFMVIDWDHPLYGNENVTLIDELDRQWVCHFSELYARFSIIENQDTALILYGNNKGQVK